MVFKVVGGSHMRMVALVVVIIVARASSIGQCTDELILDNTAELVRFGIDSTDHWWAITRPFADRYEVVIDGEVVGSYEQVQQPIFSFDGTTWAFRAATAQRSFIATNGGVRQFATIIDTIVLPSQSTDLWYVERNGTDWLLTNGSSQYRSIYSIKNVCLHPHGLIAAWIEKLPEGVLLMRNGTEIARGEDLILGGVMMSGECLYAVRSGGRWDIKVGETTIAEGLSKVAALQTNPLGDVAAWIAYSFSAPPRVQMYSPEFIEPWSSLPLDSVSETLVLSPFSALVAYHAIINRSRSVGFNGAAYPRGTQAGRPIFSHDGQTMAYASYQDENYVVVNGKRHRIDARVPLNSPLTINSMGTKAAWTSTTTLVSVDLEFETLTMGKMCDAVSDPIYDRERRTFRAIGVITGRLYLLECSAR